MLKKISVLYIFMIIIFSVSTSYSMSIKEYGSIKKFLREIKSESSDENSKAVSSKLHELYRYSEVYGRDELLSFIDILLNNNNTGENFLCRIIKEKVNGKNEYKESASMKWNISNSFYKFGKRDMLYDFNSKNGQKDENSKKSPVLSGKIYPFSDEEKPEGIVYLAKTFSSDVPLRLRISATSEYKVFINNREVLSGKGSSSVYRGVEFKGNTHYTVLVKFRGKYRDDNLRIIFMDRKDNPVKLKDEKWNYSSNFSLNQLSDVHTHNVKENIPGKDFYEGGNYLDSVKEALSYLKKSPHEFSFYEYIIKSLVKNNKHNELEKKLGEYINKFPKSKIYTKWLAQAYSENNIKKFMEIYSQIPESYVDIKMKKLYVSNLIKLGKFNEALKGLREIKRLPGTDELVVSLLTAMNKRRSLRKFLLKGVATTGRSIYYYKLGIMDKQLGLDPVPYWKQAVHRRGIWTALMNEIDLYENGIIKNKYHSSPFFSEEYIGDKNGNFRKIYMHLFEDQLFLEIEDRIDASQIDNINHKLGPFDNPEIRYILNVRNGKTQKIKYMLIKKNGKTIVKFIGSIPKSGIFIFKYTSMIGGCFFNRSKISRKFDIVSDHESFDRVKLFIKSDDYNILFKLKNYTTPGKNYKSGIVNYSMKSFLNISANEKIAVNLYRFRNYKFFGKWYGELIDSSSSLNVINNYALKGSLKEKILMLKQKLSQRYKIKGNMNYNPACLRDIQESKDVTNEELLLLSQQIFRQNGISTYISFRIKDVKSLAPLLDDEIYLYIPVDKKSGYYMNFTTSHLFENLDNMLILFKNGYKIVK